MERYSRSATILLLLVCFALSCQARVDSVSNDDEPNDLDGLTGEFFCNVDVLEIFDEPRWITYLQENLTLDSMAIDAIPAGKYTVLARLMLTNRAISCDSILVDPGYQLGEKVEKVINKYHEWPPPAYTGRHSFSSYRVQPITFVIEEEDDECEEFKQSEIIP
jgi:hypothetical protein